MEKTAKVLKTYKVNEADYADAMQHCRHLSADQGKPVTLSGKIEALVKSLAAKQREKNLTKTVK